MNEHETITALATCGHPVTFRVKRDAAGKPMASRIAKYTNRKCGPCRIADAEVRIAAGWVGPGQIKKGQEPKHLPIGTVITLELIEGKDDKKLWAGELQAEGITVIAIGAGLMGMASRLAKAWLIQKGIKVKK